MSEQEWTAKQLRNAIAIIGLDGEEIAHVLAGSNDKKRRANLIALAPTMRDVLLDLVQQINSVDGTSQIDLDRAMALLARMDLPE